MDWLQAIVLGLVQGLTEFLPVSSSGHLAIFRALLGTEPSEDLVFEVAVHAATALATIVVFRKEIARLLRGLFRFSYNDETDYVAKLCVSMIPVFIVGVFFKDAVEAAFGSLYVVGAALLITAALLAFSDWKSSGTANGALGPAGSGSPARNGISFGQAFATGIGQALAVIPGLSRSGTTISTGLICGVKRESMAQFSFLMVLVPILGESFLDIVGGDLGASSVDIAPLLLGFVSAFLSGLFACKAMVALVRRAKLKWFGLYCAIAGLAVLLFLA